jgi:uncharacterized phage infection (PIP) family protein YhgE
MSEDVNMQDTTPAEPSRDELWSQIVTGKPATPAPEPEPVVEEEETQSVNVATDDHPEEQAEEEQPQAEPKLAKRFRDSQEFITKLKGENKAKEDLIEQLQGQLKDLQTPRPKAEESAPKTQDKTPAVSDIATLLQELPEDVREELEAFPELLRGMTTLFDKRIQQMQNTVNPEIEEFRKEREKRKVQESLKTRHRLANEQLGISNSSSIDFDSPVFAQWVLANDWRKGVVTDFGNPQGFVDLLRGFLFEYPDEAQGLSTTQTVEDPSSSEKAKIERRKTASTVISRKASPERPKPKVTDPQSKAAFWDSLIGD